MTWLGQFAASFFGVCSGAATDLVPHKKGHAVAPKATDRQYERARARRVQVALEKQIASLKAENEAVRREVWQNIRDVEEARFQKPHYEELKKRLDTFQRWQKWKDFLRDNPQCE